MIAHQFSDESSVHVNNDSGSNDSTLARIIQGEQDNMPGPFNESSADQEVVQQIQRQDDKKMEEENFKYLQEQYDDW